MTGRWIVFEGMDSTVLEEQASHLAGWLRRGGVPAVVTREPTDGPVGAQLHLILSRRLTVDERAQALLSLADRLDHLYRDDDGILQELARDRYVIGIRYLLSAYADQSETVPWEWLERINAPCPWPDLTIFIDTPVQSGLERQASQGECPPEQTGIQPAGLSLRRQQYLQALERCQAGQKAIVIVAGDQSAEAIHRQCCAWVERLRREPHAA